MKLSVILSSVLAMGVVGQPVDKAGVDVGLSLPKLVDLTSNKQLTNWEVRGSAQVAQGRLLLTPERSGKHEGSVWNKNYKLSRQSFSVDVVFRVLGAKGKTGNGMAFWLLNDSQGNVEKLVRTDTSLYGGPSKFDGLAFVIDSEGPLGSTLRGYANDNSKEFNSQSQDFYKQDFGKCIIGYQDSQVPSTVRISYDGSRSQLRVSIDNKICFESSLFRLPAAENNFIVGASARSFNKQEAFEIFKINVYDKVLDSESVYDNVELASQPVIITKNTAGEVTGKSIGVSKAQQQMQQQAKQDHLVASDISQESINQILSRLSAVDKQISERLADTLQKQNAENNHLQKQIQQLSSQNDVLEKYLKEVDRKLHSLVLSEKDKKLEKETYRKQVLEKEATERSSTEKLFNRIKTFIYILIFLLLALGTFLYRLRSEIKHAKLL